MSWILSKAFVDHCENLRCSQEPVAEYLEENCLDGKPSAQSKSSDTPNVYLPPLA